jgi:hypothetical protein
MVLLGLPHDLLSRLHHTSNRSLWHLSAHRLSASGRPRPCSCFQTTRHPLRCRDWRRRHQTSVRWDLQRRSRLLYLPLTFRFLRQLSVSLPSRVKAWSLAGMPSRYLMTRLLDRTRCLDP